MKLTQSQALAILGLPTDINEFYSNGISIKKAYKIAALKSHPDRDDGCGDEMVKINSAYSLLKGLIFINEPNADIFHDDVYAKNEGHKLCGSGIPSLKPLEQLLRESLDIRNSLDPMPGTWVVHENNGSQHVYFQHLGDDFKVSWNQDNVYIYCITNAGRVGKNCGCVQISINEWNTESHSRLLINVFDLLFNAPCFHNGKADSGFSWALVYSKINKSLNEAVNISENVMEATFFDHTFTHKKERYHYDRWVLNLPNASVSIYQHEEKAISVFNPFKLDVYKPLTKIPAKFKTLDLIKVLVNGQYTECKRNYLLSDDYAFDAAMNGFKGYIENPTKMIVDWINDRGRTSGGSRVYLEGNEQVNKINFGFYLNDSSSLNVVLSNTYPLIDLTDDVIRINEGLKFAC